VRRKGNSEVVELRALSSIDGLVFCVASLSEAQGKIILDNLSGDREDHVDSPHLFNVKLSSPSSSSLEMIFPTLNCIYSFGPL
jgi:hypothetical protein